MCLLVTLRESAESRSAHPGNSCLVGRSIDRNSLISKENDGLESSIRFKETEASTWRGDDPTKKHKQRGGAQNQGDQQGQAEGQGNGRKEKHSQEHEQE